MRELKTIITTQLPGAVIVILSIGLLYIFSLLWRGDGQVYLYEYNKAILITEISLLLAFVIYGAVLWIIALRKVRGNK